MPRILSLVATLVACAPFDRDTVMPSHDPAFAASPKGSRDTPAQARGRRILSTAFVRIGPDGQLTVELRDGRILVLRDVTMGPNDYCGRPMSDAPTTKRYCGHYDDIAAVRPGGPAAVSPEA